MKMPFVKPCRSDVLRRTVIVCCGPRSGIKRLLFDPATFTGYDVPADLLKKLWRHLEKCWRAAGLGKNGVAGLETTFEGDVYIILPKWDARVFVHEAYHAVQSILRSVDTSDEELGAYLIEWLFESICWRPDGPAEKEKEKKKGE